MRKENLFIFDLDGTIVETQLSFHAAIESGLLHYYAGVKISPEELSARFAGIPTSKVFEELAPQCDATQLVNEKWEKMYVLASSKTMKCLPEMYEVIFDLAQGGHKMAIASASPLKWIEMCLRNANPHDKEFVPKDKRLGRVFNGEIFSAEDCTRPKPAPDLFLKAYKEMTKGIGVTVREALGCTYIVGDGVADVEAGLAAKFPVLYLSATNKAFDKNRWVTRFGSSQELCAYIRKISFD